MNNPNPEYSLVEINSKINKIDKKRVKIFNKLNDDALDLSIACDLLDDDWDLINKRKKLIEDRFLFYKQ